VPRTFDPIGFDELGRRVHLAFITDLSSIRDVVFPGPMFVILLAGPTADTSVDDLYSTAEFLLEKGAAYVMCWGDGSTRLEDIVDEAATMNAVDGPPTPVIMTTAHENEPLSDTLEFATTVAVPAAEYADRCRDVVMIFHGERALHEEARVRLAEILRTAES
jgi:hypothetical protein